LPSFTDDMEKVEKLLLKKLRITKSQLRAFLATYPLVGAIHRDNLLEDTSVIVESAFGLLDKTALDMEFFGPRGALWRSPTKLLDAPWAAQRVAQTTKTPLAGEPLTQLSALRIRYRIRRASDRSGTLLTFGWAFPAPEPGQPVLNDPFAGSTGSTSNSTGFTISRTNLAASEAIVDLHTWFAPGPQPDDRDRTDRYECSVPAVALFSQ
jgi:hypothetical protein